jgi:hypothetical protein
VSKPSTLPLRVGPWLFRLHGLDAALAAALRVRWGPFVSEGGEPSVELGIVDAGPGTWLETEPGEPYRLEASVEGEALVVRSHHFVLAPETPRSWRLEIRSGGGERLDRLVENAVRYLVARAAIEAGGLAFHGAGVLLDGRAHLLLGPSRAGKTTAVSLLASAVSFGDDFAAAIPEEGSWVAPAVPFDNLERVPPERPTGSFELAGLWRLFQSPEDRVERPPPVLAASSLVTCAALPWAMPDLSERILENAASILRSVPYAHLHFAESSDLRRLLRS